MKQIMTNRLALLALGAALILGGPSATQAQQGLPAEIQDRVAGLLATDDDAEFVLGLEALLGANPDLAIEIAGAVAQMRPDLGATIAGAAARAAPKSAAAVAAAVTAASPGQAAAIAGAAARSAPDAAAEIFSAVANLVPQAAGDIAGAVTQAAPQAAAAVTAQLQTIQPAAGPPQTTPVPIDTRVREIVSETIENPAVASGTTL